MGRRVGGCRACPPLRLPATPARHPPPPPPSPPGARLLQVEELYSLDPELLRTLRCGGAGGRAVHPVASAPSLERESTHPPTVLHSPIYGLVFLFKWQQEADDRQVEGDPEAKGVFFASQVRVRNRHLSCPPLLVF